MITIKVRNHLLRFESLYQALDAFRRKGKLWADFEAPLGAFVSLYGEELHHESFWEDGELNPCIPAKLLAYEVWWELQESPTSFWEDDYDE